MKTTHFFVSVTLLLFAGLVNAEGWRDFQQENRQRQREFSQQQHQHWLSHHQYRSATATSTTLDNLMSACLPFQEVHFRGVTLIDQRAFIPADGECLNEAHLNQLSRTLTEAYLQAGYLPPAFHFETDSPRLPIERLIVVVKEQRIRQIRGGDERINPSLLLPQKGGQPLNVRDLDQALDQANKLPNSTVTVDVFPDENGNVDLQFVNQATNRIGGSVAVNNFASKHYHRWQMRFGANVDSPFGLSDNLALSLSHTLKNTRQFSRSASLYYHIPYGYWSLNAMLAFSQFRQSLVLPQHTVQQKGESFQGSLGADYVVHRGSNHISTLSAQLERLNSKSYFADALLILQSPKLTAAQLGFSHLQLLESGAIIANVQYKHGLSWFNALPNLGRDQPEGHYGKWNAELQWQHAHRIGEQLFRASHQFIGQYSQNYLPAAEQADLTGRYAVRSGEMAWSAEKVLLLRNQWTWLTQAKAVHFSPYFAIDVGLAKNTADNAEQQRAWGYALGVNADYFSLWNAQLEWSSGQIRLGKNQAWGRQHQVDFSVRFAF